MTEQAAGAICPEAGHPPPSHAAGWPSFVKHPQPLTLDPKHLPGLRQGPVLWPSALRPWLPARPPHAVPACVTAAGTGTWGTP